jgi:glucose/arabinose dehydrogenase
MIKITFILYPLTYCLIFFTACNSNKVAEEKYKGSGSDTSIAQNLDSLAPISDSKTKFSNIIGWEEGEKPTAPAGFTVTRFAENIKSPRHTYVTPNGDVLIVLSNSERTITQKIGMKLIGMASSEVGGQSANTIMLYRDKDGDGIAETFESAFWHADYW